MQIDFRLSDPLMLGLRRRLLLEGESILTKEEVLIKSMKADLSFTEDLSHNSEGIRVIQGGVLHEPILSSLGYKTTSVPDDKTPRFYVTRFFDGQSFTPQIALSIPIMGLYNKECGPATIAGMGTRYYKVFQPAEVLNNKGLIEFLKASRYFGFLSSEHVADKLGLIKLHLGAPSLSIYNLMQGMNLPVAEWFRTPQRLLESWSLALLVTLQSKKEIDQLSSTPKIERRVYWLSRHENSNLQMDLVSVQREAAVVCSWSHQLRDAQQRTLEACRGIDHPQKLYRTDAATEIELVLDLIRSQLPM